MVNPHASWAKYYDFAYETEFGDLYKKLTDLTVQTVQKLASPPCCLVDFGAATGRLSIPLAKAGYAATAVDPCLEMVEVLRLKATAAEVRVQTHIQRMQDYDGQGQFDVALCVFTTLLYLLDETSLNQGLVNLAKSLKRAGRLLIDIPRREAFSSRTNHLGQHVLERRINVTPAGGDVYTYHETTRCLMDGDWHYYKDTFLIRYWPVEKVLDILRQNGVKVEGPLPEFGWTGADYYAGIRTD